MAQRYTPSQLALLVEEGNTAGLFPDVASAAALNGLEANTLVLAADFSVGGANCVVKPWVNVRSKNAAGATVDNWLPLDNVTLTAVADSANKPPVIDAARFRAPPSEVALPNCHGVTCELISVSAGNINLWGATANRPPR